jgi:OpgC protein
LPPHRDWSSALCSSMPRTSLWSWSIAPLSPASHKGRTTPTIQTRSTSPLHYQAALGIRSDAGPAIHPRQSGRASALYRAIGNVCSAVVADDSKTDADFGLFSRCVSCLTAFWLESLEFAIGRLVFQSVRLATAVFPGRLGRSWRRGSRPIDRSNTDGILACDRLPCVCPCGDDLDQLASARCSSSLLDAGAVRSQRQDQSRALPDRASDRARDRRYTVLAAEFAILNWPSRVPLIKCGQNSLPVFCTGIVLSFCAHAAIEASLSSLWVQIFVGTLGVLLMTAVAYYGTWPKRRYPILPSPGSNWQNAVPSKSV